MNKGLLNTPVLLLFFALILLFVELIDFVACSIFRTQYNGGILKRIQPYIYGYAYGPESSVTKTQLYENGGI